MNYLILEKCFMRKSNELLKNAFEGYKITGVQAFNRFTTLKY